MSSNEVPTQPKLRNIHSHMWLVGTLGILLGLILMVYVPSLPAVSGSILLFAWFHLIGGLIVLFSAYSLGLRGLLRRLFGRSGPAARSNDYDFGWGPEWMNGLALFGLAALAGSVAVMIAAPDFWLLAFLLVLLAVSFFIGNGIMRSFQSRDHMVLPMVRLLKGQNDMVLDAGCGAGRTTIMLSRILGNGRVVGLDRFDADYIDEGGRTHIDRNLEIAGLSAKVVVKNGDLTALPFEDGHFTAAVSTNVFDHLGAGKQTALNEICRVLEPGGRFLMAVWVPGWTMFAVGNVLSFFLTSKAAWRDMATAAGLRVVDEGKFNFAWFLLLEKPLAPTESAKP